MKQYKASVRYWTYHNLTVFLASIIFAYLVFYTSVFHVFFERLGTLGYFGVFLIGIVFPSSFTVIPATAALVLFAHQLSYIYVAIVAGIGATLGDYIIFRFARESLVKDIESLFRGFSGKRLRHLMKSKYFGALTPLLGALILISPLPDDWGIELLSASKISDRNFLFLSLIFNVIGLVILLGTFRLL